MIVVLVNVPGRAVALLLAVLTVDHVALDLFVRDWVGINRVFS